MSAPPELTRESYLGDGVYSGVDSMGRLWVYLNDGVQKMSAICVEPEVAAALLAQIREVYP